jgi:hypothetical protein
MKIKFILLISLCIPMLLMGQVPEDHFLDADDSGKDGYTIKPFIQEDNGIYHYTVLSELPFENDCDGSETAEDQLTCPEQTLALLVGQQINESTYYQGVVNVYFTVTERGEITNINIKTQPPSLEIEQILTEAVKQIQVRPAKYKQKTVKSRLWTKIDFKKRN